MSRAAALALLATALLVGGFLFAAGPGRNPAAGTGTTECTKASLADFLCHRRHYHALAHSSGVDAAFRQLRADYDRDDIVRLTCHQLAHAIAHAAAHVARGPAPPGEGDRFCGSGYYAGRVEILVARTGTASAPAGVNAVCADVRRRTNRSNQHHNCLHALGHGLMALARGNLSEALSGCDRLVDVWESGRCYGGVFMEHNSGPAGEGSRPGTSSRPLELCEQVGTRYETACYRQQSSYALQVYGGDFPTVFRLCAGATEQAFRRTCFQGIGFRAGGWSIADRVTNAGATTETAMLCALGRDREARSNCVVGAVRAFVDHYRDEQAARDLCDAVEGPLRPVCRQAGRAYHATL